jgi:hypothetical protein
MQAGRNAIVGLALLATAGCSEPVGPVQQLKELGVLQVVEYGGPYVIGDGDPAVNWSVPPGTGVLVPPRVLVTPDTVRAGVPFDVVVTTIGMNGCWSAAGLWPRFVERGLDLIPTDVHSGATFCTEMALYLEHHVRITIATPGEFTLRVKGRRLRHGDAAWEEPVSAHRTIVVQ